MVKKLIWVFVFVLMGSGSAEGAAKGRSSNAEAEIHDIFRRSLPTEASVQDARRAGVFLNEARVVPLSRFYKQKLLGVLGAYPESIRSIAKEVRILVYQGLGVPARYYGNGSLIVLDERLLTEGDFFSSYLRAKFDLNKNDRLAYFWFSNILPEDESLTFVYLRELSRHLWEKKFTSKERLEFGRFSWENGVQRSEVDSRVQGLCRAYDELAQNEFVSLDAMDDRASDGVEHLAMTIWTQVMRKDWVVRLPKSCVESEYEPFDGEELLSKKGSVFLSKTGWMKLWLSTWSGIAGHDMMTEHRFDVLGTQGAMPKEIHSIREMKRNWISLKWNQRQTCIDQQLRESYLKAIEKVVFDDLGAPYALEIGGGDGFYHGHILFDVQMYETEEGRRRYDEINLKLQEIVAESSNKNVDVINYLVNQPETILLFHTREGRLTSNPLGYVAGGYPTRVEEMKEALNRRSFFIRPTTGEIKELKTERFQVPPDKKQLFEFNLEEIEDFIASGVWHYKVPSPHPFPKPIGGYLYQYYWSQNLSVLFTIDSSFSVSVRGAQRTEKLTCELPRTEKQLQ